MALSIIESRAINNRISTNLGTLNSGNLPILQSRSINKSIDEDMVLLNWDKFDSEQSARTGLEPDGKDNEVKTAKGTKIVTGFMVIDASKLIVSHDEQGNANPDYPQEMQPRDRARDTSQAQIARIAKNLDPDMLGRTRVAYQGAPIIGKDGVVESGNGRAMAITLAYKLGKADEYRAWLLDIADMYGLNPDKIEHMKRPVLVRVRKTDVDRAQFAIEANQSDMLAMTATEKAKSDAARLTDAIVSKLSIEGDLTAASNRDFIMAFLQSLGDDETAGLLTTSGQPSKQLYDRAQAAVFAKAYNDDRLLELMADAEKPEIANIIKSLNQAAQPFITARNISEHAAHATTQKIGDAIDVSLDQQAVDAIIKATEMLKKAKDSGMPIEELIKQNDLFGDIDPVVAQMALFIKDNNRSPARMGAAFVAMAEFVVKELESRQNASLFDDDMAVDMVDVLKAANAQLQKQYGEDVKAIGGTGGFIDMFTETRGQKEDREAFLANEAGAGSADKTIELTGKEFGDFPDTDEGKKALRSKAVSFYDENLIKSDGVKNIALDKIIEFDVGGRKKLKSFSADPRKLHILYGIKSIIEHGIPTPNSPMQPHGRAKAKGVNLVHILKTPINLNGDNIKVRFLVYEKEDGHLFYDHSVDDADMNTALGGSGGALDSVDATDLSLSVLLPNEPSSGQCCIDSVGQELLVFNKNLLDSAIFKSGMVFNLFIEGEEPEVVEVEDDEVESEGDGKKEYAIRGIPKGESDEKLLYAKAATFEEAKTYASVLEGKYGATKTRIQVLDMQEKPDFTNIIAPEVVEPAPTPTITGNSEIDGYKSKLLGLQQLQDRMKAVNKIVNNKKLTSEQKKSALADAGYTSEQYMVDAKPKWSDGKLGYEGYQLTNNNANISSTKKRITQLEGQGLAASKANSGDSQTSYDFDGGTIELDYSADRLKVDFDAIPDSDMNSKLKRNGFKWSPTNRVWQRQLTDNAISTANYLFGTNIKTAASMMTEEENKPRPNPIIQAVDPVIEPITPIEPVQNETAEIDAEITALRALIGTFEFSDALDNLLDKLEAAGLDGDYEKVVSDIIELDAQAENAKIGA